MFEGRILKEGLPEDLANDPQVREAYLGENFVYQSIDNRPKKKEQIYHVFSGNFENRKQLEAYAEEHFQGKDVQIFHDFKDISFASLANSEIEHVFNNLVDKNQNNSFIFQKETIGKEISADELSENAKKQSTNLMKYQASHPFVA